MKKIIKRAEWKEEEIKLSVDSCIADNNIENIIEALHYHDLSVDDLSKELMESYFKIIFESDEEFIKFKESFKKEYSKYINSLINIYFSNKRNILKWIDRLRIHRDDWTILTSEQILEAILMHGRPIKN